MSITKSDIANNIAFETCISKKDSKNIVSSFISLIASNSYDKDVKLAKFGTFKSFDHFVDVVPQSSRNL